MAGQQPDPKAAAKQLMGIGAEIDRALLALSEVATEGSKEFGQARELIKLGLAKFLSSKEGPGAVAATPTAVGNSFPGGGFSSSPVG